MSTSALPTAETFATLPLLQRARVFGDWLKAQPREATYDWNSSVDCALGRFAQALFRTHEGRGGTHRIGVMEEDGLGTTNLIEVFPGGMFGRCSDALDGTVRGVPGSLTDSTFPPKQSMVFGEVSDAYEAALAAEITHLQGAQ